MTECRRGEAGLMDRYGPKVKKAGKPTANIKNI